MIRRRRNPYSKVEKIASNRKALFDLLLIGVFLGFLVNLLSGALYDYLTVQVMRSAGSQRLALAAGIGASVVVLIYFVNRFYNRFESEQVQLDVAIPYRITPQGLLTVPRQHPYRPSYEAAAHAQRMFTFCFPPTKEPARELAAEWREQDEPGLPFQQFIDTYHQELLDALLLRVLHRYGEDSLSKESRYGWWQVDLASKRLDFDGLPHELQSNRFVRRQLAQEADWYLLLPERATLTIEGTETGRRWVIAAPHYGQITVSIDDAPWVATKRHQAVQVLGEGIGSGTSADFWVLGSRILAVADSRMTLFAGMEAYHEWATQFLAFLEEALDWKYFLLRRPDRMLVDLPWKIGDLPRHGSLWQKLEHIENHLSRIEERVSESEEDSG